LELDASDVFNLETMQRTQPLIGLLLSQDADNLQPTSLLAQVETIERLDTSPTGKQQELENSASANRIAIELSFPESLRRQQHSKIQRLLKTLD
jgi:cellulose synthase (UDP-forming)